MTSAHCTVLAQPGPALSAAALIRVMAMYPGLGAFEALDWQSARPFAASGIVRCQGARVFVKRHDARVRGLTDLADEHRFIAHLHAQGVEVPRVVLTRDGAGAVAQGLFVYEVHALCAGNDAYRDAPSWTPVRSAAEARALGRALGVLHKASAGFTATARQTRLIVAGDFVTRMPDLQAAIQDWAAQDGRLRAALHSRPWQQDVGRILQPWHGPVQSASAAVAPCWVHGDFHASNLLWHGQEVAAVLDFGLSNRASAIYDLATAIERNAISWLALREGHDDIGHAGLACAVLDGYARGAGLTDDDARFVRQLLPLVHVEFALSELSYFHGITGSADDAERAYSAFLLGHAAWFGRRHGATLLQALR